MSIINNSQRNIFFSNILMGKHSDALNITLTDFRNLWKLIVIGAAISVVPAFLVCLLPQKTIDTDTDINTNINISNTERKYGKGEKKNPFIGAFLVFGIMSFLIYSIADAIQHLTTHMKK